MLALARFPGKRAKIILYNKPAKLTLKRFFKNENKLIKKLKIETK